MDRGLSGGGAMRFFQTARTTTFIRLLPVAILAVMLSGCQAGRLTPPAPIAPAKPAGKLVWTGKYVQDIQPIFDQRCVTCHGPSRADNGLRLSSYSDVMKGTQYGPVVVRGDPNRSALLSVLTGTTDPSIRMPHGGQRLTEQEIQNITLWIEAGAPGQ